MPLPDFPRLTLQKNPLEQVICQLRFPQILKIDMQAPFEFQDIIRQEYPMYAASKENQPEMSPEITAQIPPGSIGIPAVDKINYRFFTTNEAWVVNLASQFVFSQDSGNRSVIACNLYRRDMAASSRLAGHPKHH